MKTKFVLTPEVRRFAYTSLGVRLRATDHDIIDATAKAVARGQLSRSKLAALCGTKEDEMPKTKPSKLFASAAKGSSKRYSPERPLAKHAKTGKPVSYGGKAVKDLSELQLAKMGAFARFMILRTGAPLRPLDDHERGLVSELLETDTFHSGLADQEENFKLVSGQRVKALLNDSTSGGVYSTPYWFDEAFITYPLLHSELFPAVDVRDMPLSNRIESFSVNNVAVGWGTSEGTAITPFSTTGLVTEITASVFPCQVAVECGRDWLNDSPVQVGQALVEIVGQRLLAELDKMIAIGDGVTQPQGLTNATGFTAINSDNGVFGPPTVSDAEGLIFGVPLQYRRHTEWNPSYVMNDTTFRRFRAIPVGPADERRVFGMDEQTYKLLDYPVRISADMPNAKVAFAALKKFRLWRRAGFEIRWADLGQTLMLKNTALLVVRGRFAGKLLDGAAMAMGVDFQA